MPKLETLSTGMAVYRYSEQSKEEIQKKLMEDFGLDVDVADLFNCSGSLKFEAFKSLMLSKAA